MHVIVANRPEPWKFPKATGFAVTKDGSLWVFEPTADPDQPLRRIAIFAPGGWLGFFLPEASETELREVPEMGFHPRS